MSTDPTQSSPDVPDLPAGRWSEQLDEWLRVAVRFSVREGEQGLPAFERPEGETPAEKRAAYLPWFYALTNFLWHGTIAGLLIRIAQLAPEHADAIADELDRWLDSGDFYPEWVWEWANQRGLDPDALAAETRERLKQEAAEQ